MDFSELSDVRQNSKLLFAKGLPNLNLPEAFSRKNGLSRHGILVSLHSLSRLADPRQISVRLSESRPGVLIPGSSSTLGVRPSMNNPSRMRSFGQQIRSIPLNMNEFRLIYRNIQPITSLFFLHSQIPPLAFSSTYEGYPIAAKRSVALRQVIRRRIS